MADNQSRTGVHYTTPEISAYANRIHAAHDAALERAFAAPAQQNMPSIQLAASEGRLLTLLLQLVAARKVVEVGTLAGYSALRIVRGLAPDGKLWTFEIDPHHAQVARDNLCVRAPLYHPADSPASKPKARSMLCSSTATSLVIPIMRAGRSDTCAAVGS
jgi:hypothetical protein